MEDKEFDFGAALRFFTAHADTALEQERQATREERARRSQQARFDRMLVSNSMQQHLHSALAPVLKYHLDIADVIVAYLPLIAVVTDQEGCIPIQRARTILDRPKKPSWATASRSNGERLLETALNAKMWHRPKIGQECEVLMETRIPSTRALCYLLKWEREEGRGEGGGEGGGGEKPKKDRERQCVMRACSVQIGTGCEATCSTSGHMESTTAATTTSQTTVTTPPSSSSQSSSPPPHPSSSSSSSSSSPTESSSSVCDNTTQPTRSTITGNSGSDITATIPSNTTSISASCASTADPRNDACNTAARPTAINGHNVDKMYSNTKMTSITVPTILNTKTFLRRRRRRPRRPRRRIQRRRRRRRQRTCTGVKPGVRNRLKLKSSSARENAVLSLTDSVTVSKLTSL